MNVKETDGTNYYCPETFIDQEGPNCLKPGEWRQGTNNMNEMVSIRDLGASNNYGEDSKRALFKRATFHTKFQLEKLGPDLYY